MNVTRDVDRNLEVPIHSAINAPGKSLREQILAILHRTTILPRDDLLEVKDWDALPVCHPDRACEWRDLSAALSVNRSLDYALRGSLR